MRYLVTGSSSAALAAAFLFLTACDSSGATPPASADAAPGTCSAKTDVSSATGTCEGPVGPQGPAGPQGDVGPQGPKGDRGLTGPAGTNGTNGTNGANGIQGPAGQNGTNGATGATGPRGFTGLRGPAGPTMVIYGKDGIPGVNFSYGSPVALSVGRLSDGSDTRLIASMYAHDSSGLPFPTFPEGYIVTLQPSGPLYYSNAGCSGTTYQAATDLANMFSNVLYREYTGYPRFYQAVGDDNASFAVHSKLVGTFCSDIPGPVSNQFVYGHEMALTSFGINTNANVAIANIVNIPQPWHMELE